ncbi:MAG: hypothetical protein NTW96_25260 [Planctomycetia bacterium]|nr:hypothetical protein [Planctomycetia bacterium]
MTITNRVRVSLPCVLSLVSFCVLATAAPAGDELPPSDQVRPELYATGFEFAEGPAFNPAGDLFVVNFRGNGNIGRIAADGTAGVFRDLRTVVPGAKIKG